MRKDGCDDSEVSLSEQFEWGLCDHFEVCLCENGVEGKLGQDSEACSDNDVEEWLSKNVAEACMNTEGNLALNLRPCS